MQVKINCIMGHDPGETREQLADASALLGMYAEYVESLPGQEKTCTCTNKGEVALSPRPSRSGGETEEKEELKC